MEFVPRFLDLPARSCFIFGPRGTGKSTWLLQRAADALYLDLLDPELYRRLQARPEHLRALVEGSPERQTIVVDEVQRVPELLNVVHALIESHPDRRFVLTGSSARKLRRGGVDLLAGRAVVRSLHPFMAAELPDFALGKALQIGLLPLVLAAADPKDVLGAYAGLYLEQEVRAEGWARDVGNFARFLEAISFSHASILNVAAVSRECEIERKTASGYVEILEDLLLSFRLPVFQRRARRKPTTHPKFYLFDCGVYRSLRPHGPLDRPEAIEGCALEGLVAQHLRAWIAYSRTDQKLYFWRTAAGTEVDFVLYGGDSFWAIEVKNAARVRPEDLRALRTFRGDYPECRAILLYRGTERLVVDDVWCVPVEEFLQQLKPSGDLLAWIES